MNATVHILGVGLRPRDHATVEVLQALADCDSVHAQGLRPDDALFVRRFCRRGAFRALPVSAEPRRAAASFVAAARRGRREALVTPLHPFLFSALGPRLAQACDAARVPWLSLGAVSPLGAAISEAGVTLGTTVFGLQSFEAEAVAAGALAPNPVWPLALYFLRAPRPEVRVALSTALAGLGYPSGHAVLWCAGAATGTREPLQAALRRAARAEVGDTLYFPEAVRTRSRLGRTETLPLVEKGPSAPATVEG